MKRLLYIVPLAAVLASCGSDAQVAGTDEHGNAVAARVLVRDSSGAPAAGVAVVFRPSGWLDGEPLDSASSAGSGCVTDRNGSCLFSPDSGSSDLTVRAGDGERAAAATVPSNTASDIVLRLAPTGSVQGSLQGAKAGVAVRVPGLPGIAWTDESGRFSLGSLPAGFRRVRVGNGLVALDSVPVLSGKASTFALPMPVAPVAGPVVLDSIDVRDLPNTPVFSPPGGTYATAQEIVFKGVDPGDAVETSLDGIRWEILNGSVRVMSSTCLKARAVHDGRILSNTSEACYVVGP